MYVLNITERFQFYTGIIYKVLNIWNVNFEERGASNKSSVEVYV